MVKVRGSVSGGGCLQDPGGFLQGGEVITGSRLDILYISCG